MKNNIRRVSMANFVIGDIHGELEQLKMLLGKMDLNNGEVLIKGSIDSLEYSLKDHKKESLVKRLFK
jgi:hypothetical protein